MKKHSQEDFDPEMSEDDVVVVYRDYVERIAGKLIKGLKIRVEHDDLISYGLAGLLQAWRRYDPNSPAAFTSYAYYRIRGSMLDGCRKEGWVTRERKTSAAKQAAINDHNESQFAASADRAPSQSVADSLDRLTQTVGNTLTIMMVQNADLDAVLPPSPPRQDVRLEQKHANERLNHALSQLEETERVLVKRHHYYEESLTDIAKELGLSTSWCSRIHARAIEQLRLLLSEPDDPVPA